MAANHRLKADGKPRAPIHRKIGPACVLEGANLSGEARNLLTQAGVISMGMDSLSGEYHVSTDCSATHLLYFVVSGEISCESAQPSHLLRTGDLLVAPANGPHAIKLGASPCKAVWFHLDDAPQWVTLHESGHHVQKALAWRDIEHAMTCVLRESRSIDINSKQSTLLYVMILLIYLQRELRDLRSPAERNIRHKLLCLRDTVRERPSENWTVSALSNWINVSPSYLYALCRKQFGIQPIGMVTRIRMEQAQNLLIHTNFKIEDIAGRVGYRSEYSFSDAFKRTYGQRPGAYRRIHAAGATSAP